MSDQNEPSILSHKSYSSPSIFTPQNMLREARRQKTIPEGVVPKACILDPDGDIVQNLIASGQAQLNSYWACYHTHMYNFTHKGIDFGVVGNAVGASFAVLVADEMFACGCEFLISMTSAGQIVPKGTRPYFVLIDKALRDEGTSYHYLPPAPFEKPRLPSPTAVRKVFLELRWRHRRSMRLLRQKGIKCFAHITNQMGNVENDFEKGEAQGSRDAIDVISQAAEAWLCCADENKKCRSD